MAPRNKAALRGTVRKRDKAYDTLNFNKKYLGVADTLLTQKDEKLYKQQELKSKKKLLPLELAALPEADRNEVRFARELDAFRAKQSMKRRAIRQTYLRRVEKRGEAEAAGARDAALAALDARLEAKAAELRRKYPEGGSAAAPAEAAARYAAALAEETARLDALRARQQAEKKKKLDALHTKLSTQNQKLQAVFDSTNSRLHERSTIHAEGFGEDAILDIRGLKMYFSGIKAVDDLSFQVKQGEIFGLIGPNGAGKSTVFNCITQFYKSTAGEIIYRDRFGNLVNLADYKTAEVIKAGIARTFQNLELVYWLSVLDNLLVGSHAFYRATLADQFLHTGKLKREEEVFHQRAIDLLDRLGILAYKDMSPYGLPYGVLKKVELARTLMSSPRLIILDEPAAGLNDAETEDLAEIIQTIRDDFDCTIILVEHDMNLVMNICDTVCAISFGKMLAIGEPEDIQDSPQVQEAYLGTE